VVAAMQDLLSMLDVEQRSLTSFLGPAAETSLQRVFGGQVLAQGLVAAARTVPSDRPVHSLHGYFLAAGATGVPISYEVDRLRDGRSFTNRRVLASQDGRAIFHMTLSFQTAEDGFEHQEPMPSAPGPDGLPTHAERLRISGRDVDPEEWAVLDVRHATTESDSARQQVWMRTIGQLPDDPLVHAATIAYASDLTLLGTALRPHGIGMSRDRVVTASLDHAMWFHLQVRADQWLLYDQDTPAASGGRGLSRGRIFDADGRLVVTAVQEGVMRWRSTP
jgi:acyl-CoA thioesterase II